MDYRTYNVKRREKEPLLDWILSALKGEGCTVIKHTIPDRAPFRISFETPAGERMGILCYAFFANCREIKNRPKDECRFQIKYGANDKDRHSLWQDPYGLYTTLFFGVNTEEGWFVAADPALHSPTRFYISLEFKKRHVAAIRSQGWHAWTRERRETLEGPEDLVEGKRAEVLVGGTAKSFLRYVRFERSASGLDQGHRHLLAEKGAGPIELVPPLSASVPESVAHILATEFQMSEHDVLDLIASASRLKMAVRGWVAEEHLTRTLSTVEGVSECVRLDIEGGADVQLRYRGSRPLTLQCKNVLRKPTAAGLAKVDFQKTRASKKDPCTRYYRADEFDVVAACLHAMTERWEFSYVLPDALPLHSKCLGRVSNNVRVDASWTGSAERILEEAARR